jgi:predicted permease
LHYHNEPPVYITDQPSKADAYDHTHRTTRDPVRSPIDKPVMARLVLGWVTTGESLVLYVLSSLLLHRTGIVHAIYTHLRGLVSYLVGSLIRGRAIVQLLGRKVRMRLESISISHA